MYYGITDYTIIIGASEIFSSAQFGPGSGHIWLDDVACEGGEDSVFDCEYLLDTHLCTHSNDVGVGCYGIIGRQQYNAVQ